MGNLHESLEKKVFCVKKVTKLPDLTVYIKKYLFHGEGRGYIGPCYVGEKYEKR